MKSVAEIAPIIEETASVGAEEDATFEARGDENEEVALLSELGGGAPLEESEVSRRRRRRRRRRGERPFGDNPPQEAPQPTDEGLAVVAEIGGDLVASSGDGDSFDRRGLGSGAERHRRSRGSRGGRNRFRQPDGEAAVETSAPGFDSPPPMVIEQGFAASEADYSATLRSGDPVSHEETTIVPSLVAEAEEHETEEQVTRAAGAEPADAPFSTAADTAAPSAAEPSRPRRSGWWQRARASVIGK
jgi:ribonuclease E